jgi:hypothetical protein
MFLKLIEIQPERSPNNPTCLGGFDAIRSTLCFDLLSPESKPFAGLMRFLVLM